MSRPTQVATTNADGEMATRDLATFLPAVGSTEAFHYGYAHRVLRMDVTWDGMPAMTRGSGWIGKEARRPVVALLSP